MTDELTNEEAAIALRWGINALFAQWRDAEACERTAYFEARVDGDLQRFVYVAFRNGMSLQTVGYDLINTGGNAPLMPSVQKAIWASIRAVAQAFPDHAAQQVVWRTPPEVNRWPADSFTAPDRSGTLIWNAGASAYVRLVATPLGV